MNDVHERDREKASSIMQNLVYRKANDLGRFKYIFSKRLREQYFTKLDKAKLNLKTESKLALGQISNNEITDQFRRKAYLELINLLWEKSQLKQNSTLL